MNETVEKSSATAPSTASPTGWGPAGAHGTRIDWMLDIETLSTEKDALMLSIAIVLFDPFGEPGSIVKEYHWPIKLEDQTGGKLSIDTVLDFWFKQPEAAAAITKLRAEKPHMSVELLAYTLRQIYDSDTPQGCVWGNAPSFDCDIIATALARASYEKPWKFWKERCYRTFKAEFGHLVQLPKAELAHDALSDARAQAKGVQLMMKALQYGGDQVR